MKIRYFDHSATTPVDRRVLEKMLPYFSQEYGNPSSIYSLGKKNKEIINIYRMKIANALNCKVNEIYFTSCGSESDNMILKGIAGATNKNHIITSTIEHPAILNTCRSLEKIGYKVTYINPKQNGIIDPIDVENKITRNTFLISIMFANNEIGTIQPIYEIGKIARKYNLYFHSDCVQAACSEKIDVKKYNLGAISLSSHKFYGPKGVGVAYINENIPFIRIQDGGHQEKNKRAGTENVPGIVGTGEALELAIKEMNENNTYIRNLRNYFLKELANKFKNVRINGDIDRRLPGNANIVFEGFDGGMILEELDKKGICASSGSACSAGLLNPSHVLLAIGLPNSLAKSSLRITFGKDNTFEDVDFLIKSLEEIIKK